MNFSYTVSRENIGDFSASGIGQPTFTSYSKTNNFLSGMGVRFGEGPLSATESWVVLSLLDSYLSISNVNVAPHIVACYKSCEEACYDYYMGSDIHEFSLNEASISLIEDKPHAWREKILIANNIYDEDLYRKFDNRNSYIEKSTERLSSYAEKLFGFAESFTSIKVKVNLSHECFNEIAYRK